MKKLRTLFALLLLLNAVNVKAQVLQQDSIVGVWICRDAIIPDNLNMPKEELEALKVFKGGVINSKFLFKPTGLFEWQFQKEVPPMFKEMSFLNNQKWFIDVEKGMIHIGNPKDNLMQIMVREKDGVNYFILSDTPLLLRMQKE